MYAYYVCMRYVYLFSFLGLYIMLKIFPDGGYQMVNWNEILNINIFAT